MDVRMCMFVLCFSLSTLHARAISHINDPGDDNNPAPVPIPAPPIDDLTDDLRSIKPISQGHDIPNVEKPTEADTEKNTDEKHKEDRDVKRQKKEAVGEDNPTNEESKHDKKRNKLFRNEKRKYGDQKREKNKAFNAGDEVKPKGSSDASNKGLLSEPENSEGINTHDGVARPETPDSATVNDDDGDENVDGVNIDDANVYITVVDDAIAADTAEIKNAAQENDPNTAKQSGSHPGFAGTTTPLVRTPSPVVERLNSILADIAVTFIEAAVQNLMELHSSSKRGDDKENRRTEL